MINKLEDKLDEEMMLRQFLLSQDEYRGFKEAINFCIRKHKEKWNINDFREDLIQTKMQYKDWDCSYIEGIVSGLKYNIKLMEEQHELISENSGN